MPTDPFIIPAGSLRHEIAIQAASTTRDPAGQPIATWNTVLTTRASITSSFSTSYKESFSNNALASQATDFVTIRWPGQEISIKPGMRMIFGDNTYLIQAVDNVMRRNRKVNLACLVIDGDSN